MPTLREKCPNTELFLVRIFPHSDWIRRGTKYLSVFSPNAGKYGPQISPYLDTFHAVLIWSLQVTVNRFGILTCYYLQWNFLAVPIKRLKDLPSRLTFFPLRWLWSKVTLGHCKVTIRGPAGVSKYFTRWIRLSVVWSKR